jgi:hypothetical protein
VLGLFFRRRDLAVTSSIDFLEAEEIEQQRATGSLLRQLGA